MRIPPTFGGFAPPAPVGQANPFAQVMQAFAPQPQNRGGFMSRGAAQNQGSLPITQAVLMSEAEKRRESARKLQEKAFQQMQEAAQLEAPQSVKPITGGEAGIGSLLMLLASALGGGNGASEFAQGFMQARQQNANQTNEENMRRYGMQNQQMNQLAGIDLERAKLEMGDANRIEDRLTTERNRTQSLQDKELQRKQTALSGVINRLSSDLDRAPYERIPVIIGQMNEAYRQMGMPEMVIEQGSIDQMVAQAKKNADEATNIKRQNSRTSLLRALMPYVPEEGRGELMDWVANMRDQDLDVTVGMSEAELNQRARTEGQKITNQIKQAEAAVAKEYYQNRVKLQAADYDLIREKIKYYPQTIQLALARFEVQSALAGNTLGNTAFDNALSEWKARNEPYVAQLKERAKQAQEKLDALAKNANEASPEKKQEVLRKQNAELTALTSELQKINTEIMRVSKSAPRAERYNNPEAPVPVFGGGIGLNFNPGNTGTGAGGGKPNPAPNPNPNPAPKPAGKGKTNQTVNVSGTQVKVKTR